MKSASPWFAAALVISNSACIRTAGNTASACWVVATAQAPPETLRSEGRALTEIVDGFAVQNGLTPSGEAPGAREYVTSDQRHRLTLAYGMGPLGTVVTVFSREPAASAPLTESVKHLLSREVATRWTVRSCAEAGMPLPTEHG
jgi:hypothetical protein